MSLFACTINPAVTVVTDYLCVTDAANAARAASSSAASEVLLGLLNDLESASESEVSAGMYCHFGLANGPRNSLKRSANMVRISPFVTACLKRYVDHHIVTMLHSNVINLQSKCKVTLTLVFQPCAHGQVNLCDLCDLWSCLHHHCQHGACKKHNKSSL